MRSRKSNPYIEELKTELARVLPVILAVLICGAGAYLASRPLLAKRPPESAEARLIRVDTGENPEYMTTAPGDHARHPTRPIWSFTAADGETYEVEGRYVAHWYGGPSVGDTSTIHYYPERPDHGYIIEADQSISQSLDIYIALFPVLFLIVFFGIRRKEAQERRSIEEP